MLSLLDNYNQNNVHDSKYKNHAQKARKSCYKLCSKISIIKKYAQKLS